MEAVRTGGRSKRVNFTTHDENIYHALGQAREAAKYRTNAWTATQERMFRDLAERRARHQGKPLPEWRDPPNQVRVTTSTPCCASSSLHSKEGGNVFVPVTLAGTTVLALADMDRTSFELRAGGWQVRKIDSIRLCATEDHSSVESVGLRQGLYDTDHRQSNLHSILSIDWHYEALPRVYSTVDDDDSMWELEAVQALQLDPREEPSTFDCPRTNRPRRDRHDDRCFSRLALCMNEDSGDSPPNSRNLSGFPKTLEEVLRMCNFSTQAKLSATEREQLKQPCLSYPDFWNTGDRPLATANLAKFVVTLKVGVEL
ncbi:hypothetical protein Efla_000218 [Eimeria flavescens]